MSIMTNEEKAVKRQVAFLSCFAELLVSRIRLTCQRIYMCVCAHARVCILFLTKELLTSLPIFLIYNLEIFYITSYLEIVRVMDKYK